MGKIGCFGKVLFLASSEAVQTIEDAQWSGSARYAQHDVHLRKSLPEFIGVDDDSLAFDLTLSAFYGSDPLTDIDLLHKYRDEGTPQYLVLGRRSYGVYKWVVEKDKIQLKRFDGSGNLIEAVVSLSLLEYPLE